MDLAGVLLALLLVLVLVVSLLSNLLVLLCFVYSTEIRKQVAGVFLVNLSFCNLLLTVLNMPFTLLGILRNQQPLGGCVCKAVGFLETFLTSNTMLSMAALSIDKWIAVVFPLSYTSKMRYKDAVILMGYSWFHSLTFPLVSLFYSWVDYNSVYASCTLHLKEETERRRFTVFTIVFHSTSFMLSLVILCFTYLKVLKVARFHCKRIDIITMQTLVLLVDIHPSVKQRCLNEQKRRRQRATKKISIFIGSFVICFGPYIITRLIELLPFVTINYYWGIISKCLTYSKAASDPFVYSLLRQQYKKVLINIVNRILKRDLYPSSGYNSSLDTENDYCLHRTN
ncbi:G-protein coupled receptor 78 [Corvus cornix cornix]|nr:G-protein coupled receptor 78 [Corvus cornix cornix]XP_031965901.1 G-protein coupled receptor 78 [Corvus moneduloides]XP_041909537.1 G-protein coupled receptor 78 [Corvus kubaryi]NWW61084.1 GPR26 protein [Ifrita kowaldi]NWY12785.1 GPR26 protein [Aphelocoma coerulescens]NXH32721.1 GPR26 protein [Myiagra hebetior]NXD55954.1 GPR26 protein [Corvus moneduloides]